MEEEKLDKILKKIDGIGESVNDLGVRVEKTEKQVNNIAVAVVSMQEQLKNCVTQDHLDERINSVLTSTDRFVKLHETLDQELAMLRSKYNRLEERVLSLEQRTLATA